MIKKLVLTFLCISLTIFILGCSDEKTKDPTEYKARVSDFEENFFTNKNNQSIGLTKNGLRINGYYDKEAKSKSSLDEIISSISEGSGNHVEKTFTNAEIKIEDDKYYITADEGISLVFKKVGERIIKDEKGTEYSTPKYPEKK